MNFKTLAKNIVKGAILSFIVGFALAELCPLMGLVAGENALAIGITAHPLWSATFFGAFGAVAAAVKPIGDWIFGDSTQDHPLKEKLSNARQVNIIVTPQKLLDPALAPDSSYRQKIEAERALLEADRAIH